jgi:hypothetical protein
VERQLDLILKGREAVSQPRRFQLSGLDLQAPGDSGIAAAQRLECRHAAHQAHRPLDGWCLRWHAGHTDDVGLVDSHRNTSSHFPTFPTTASTRCAVTAARAGRLADAFGTTMRPAPLTMITIDHQQP